MADSCCRVGCDRLGTKSCVACGVASYCSVECQKGDWKVHKHSCINMNKLPTTFLSVSEIDKYGEKLYAQVNILQSQGKVKETITLRQRYLEFIEHQYGVQVEGKSYWRRSNGDLLDDMILINIRLQIAASCLDASDPSSGLAPAIEARKMLEHRDRSNDTTLNLLVSCEHVISASYFRNLQIDKAEHHCQQSLMFARLIKGEGRITSEYRALHLFSAIRQGQYRYPEAVEFAEQAYILVSEAHGPVHPRVQDAASRLIQSLIAIKDYSRADDYCRMNFENLTDPRNGVDQDSTEVADGMMQIAKIWLLKPSVDDEEAAFALAEEAEDMARKSCSIAIMDYLGMPVRYTTFGAILTKRGKYTDETRMVLEQVLALKRQNVFSPTLPTSLNRLVDFHDHVSGTMPPGDARDRELQLRDEYKKEIDSLRVARTCIGIVNRA